MICNGIGWAKRYGVMPSISCLIAFILIWVGCAPVSMVKKAGRNISRGLGSSKGNLKKSIGVVPFANESAFPTQNMQEIFQSAVVKTIHMQCEDTLILKPGDQKYPEELARLKRLSSGGIDSLSLVSVGKQNGLNAILTGRLFDLHNKEEKRGYLWFKDTCHVVSFTVNLEVYDTETGAKLLDESRIRRVEVEEADLEDIRSKKANGLSVIQDAIGAVAEEMGEEICEILSRQPWKGYVISVDGKKVTISAGGNAGILPGHVFDVYDSARVIAGMENQTFFIPGEKIGEVRIDLVLPDRAVAIVVSGDSIKTGDCLRLK